MTSRWMPAHTNNFEPGRNERKIDLVILHWSDGESLSTTDIKFINSKRLASAHYAVEDTEIHQYVKDEDTAFHSGSFEVDRRSIGIIVTGGATKPVTNTSYQTLASMLEEICRKYRIVIDSDHIKGHKEVTQGNCPGTLDMIRIIEAIKALSPKSIIEKLTYEKSELQITLDKERRSSDILTAKLEELQLLYSKKDEQYVKKCEDLIITQIRIEKLETIIRDMIRKKVPSVSERIRKFFGL